MYWRPRSFTRGLGVVERLHAADRARHAAQLALGEALLAQLDDLHLDAAVGEEALRGRVVLHLAVPKIWIISLLPGSAQGAIHAITRGGDRARRPSLGRGRAWLADGARRGRRSGEAKDQK